jgi:hypothetical protein
MKLLPKLVLAGLIVGGGIYAVRQYHISVPFIGQLQQGSVKELGNGVGTQTKLLSERTQQVSGHVQNVLGAFVQENTDDSSSSAENASSEPLHEKAFDYGRYLYCQQVVKDFETEQQGN